VCEHPKAQHNVAGCNVGGCHCCLINGSRADLARCAAPSPGATAPLTRIELAKLGVEIAECAEHASEDDAWFWADLKRAVHELLSLRRLRADEEGRGQFERGRVSGIEEAVRVLGRVVFTEVRGLERLTLTGPERDDWIVRTTARKTIGLVTTEIRALTRAPSPSLPDAPTSEAPGSTEALAAARDLTEYGSVVALNRLHGAARPCTGPDTGESEEYEERILLGMPAPCSDHAGTPHCGCARASPQATTPAPSHDAKE
jgi:hypothetical protein